MNDAERELWVLNHEPLYNWHRRSGLSMRAFLRKYRKEVDEAIKGAR